MKSETKVTIAVWTGAAAAAILLALIPMDGHAAPTASLAKWERLNDTCRGALVYGVKECAQRDKLTKIFEARGDVLYNHDVWIEHDRLVKFGTIVRCYEQLAHSADMTGAKPAMAVELRDALRDDQLFAVWNAERATVRNKYPTAWALMSEIMNDMAHKYAQSNDVRFMLEY